MPEGATHLREYLRANLFDGDEGGTVTMPIATLLDELCDLFQWHSIEHHYRHNPNTGRCSTCGGRMAGLQHQHITRSWAAKGREPIA